MKEIQLTEKDEARFWSHVDKKSEDECWEWTAGKIKDGYGIFNASNGSRYYAHRISLYIKTGSQGEVSRHSCDNPSCCNPKHLDWGTHQDNANDKVSRDRQSRKGGCTSEKASKGECHVHSKFTEDMVIQIRELYDAGGITMKEIAARHGVHKTCITKIVRRLSWKHI